MSKVRGSPVDARARAAVLAWIAGIVSVLATLVAGADSQSRMFFDAGRTGLLPARLGQVRPRSGTPLNALLFMTGAGAVATDLLV